MDSARQLCDGDFPKTVLPSRGVLMIRLQFELDLEYTVLTPSADFFFYIHAANTQQ